MLYLIPLWRCVNCENYKRSEEFNKSNTLKYRPVQHKCKNCEKEYRTQNKEKISLRQKKYAQNHREIVRKHIHNWQVKNKEKRRLYLDQNKEKITKQRREYYLKNKEAINKYNKIWAVQNKNKIKKTKQEYHAKHREKRRQASKDWRKNNPEQDRSNRQKYTKQRRQTDPDYRLKCLLRGSLNTYIRNEKGQKRTSVIKLIGCDFQTFKAYITQQFEPGMSWEKRNFHLDHICACAAYDFTDIEEQKLCYKYTNYRPLFPKENQIKQASDKRLSQFIKSLPAKNKKMIRELIFQNKLRTDNFSTTYAHINNVNIKTAQSIRVQDCLGFL